MTAITTHVLDTARGAPAMGIRVTLEVQFPDGGWNQLGRGITDSDGRVASLLPDGVTLTAAVYRLTFDTKAYLPDGLFPTVTIAFQVRDTARHYHIPLLLSPFGYTTYRGS